MGYVKVVTFKVRREVFEELDRVARERCVTRSEIIREALELYLKGKCFGGKYIPVKIRVKRVVVY